MHLGVFDSDILSSGDRDSRAVEFVFRSILGVFATFKRRVAEIHNDVVCGDLKHAVTVVVSNYVVPRFDANRFFDNDVVAIDLDLRRGTLGGPILALSLPQSRRGRAKKKTKHERR